MPAAVSPRRPLAPRALQARKRDDAMGELFAIPGISVETLGPNVRRYGIDTSTPFMGGRLGFEGNYQIMEGTPFPQEGTRPGWGAKLRYRREF